jgi:hypothetical protein
MRTTLGLLVASSLTFATPAFADLKCGDGRMHAPFAFGEDDLAVTWIGPVPKNAKVRAVDEEVFRTLERQIGPEIPAGFPDKYLKDLQRMELANAQMSTNLPDAAAWLKRYGVEMQEGPSKMLQGYIDRGHNIFSTLIDHPAVANAGDVRACSIVLQRGIIVMGEGYETLYLRSYFHSSDGKGSEVNFAPKGGLKISFPSKSVWFPLELTKYIFEPSAHVVLDILTPHAAKLAAPSPFRSIGGRMKATLGAQDYFVSRYSAVLERGKDWPDFVTEIGR